jgi:hypothetical protein
LIGLDFSLLEPLGRLTTRPWASEVTGLQIDSRRIEEGNQELVDREIWERERSVECR